MLQPRLRVRLGLCASGKSTNMGSVRKDSRVVRALALMVCFVLYDSSLVLCQGKNEITTIIFKHFFKSFKLKFYSHVFKNANKILSKGYRILIIYGKCI